MSPYGSFRVLCGFTYILFDFAFLCLFKLNVFIVTMEDILGTPIAVFFCNNAFLSNN
jgi:hypothetical protein